jgi:hypothetical protein
MDWVEYDLVDAVSAAWRDPQQVVSVSALGH